MVLHHWQMRALAATPRFFTLESILVNLKNMVLYITNGDRGHVALKSNAFNLSEVGTVLDV